MEDTVTISREEYDNLKSYKNIIDSLEQDLYLKEAIKISNLVKDGKMKVYSQEEVMKR